MAIAALITARLVLLMVTATWQPCALLVLWEAMYPLASLARAMCLCVAMVLLMQTLVLPLPVRFVRLQACLCLKIPAVVVHRSSAVVVHLTTIAIAARRAYLVLLAPISAHRDCGVLVLAMHATMAPLMMTLTRHPRVFGALLVRMYLGVRPVIVRLSNVWKE